MPVLPASHSPRGISGVRGARDEHVAPVGHRLAQHRGDVRGQSTRVDEIVEGPARGEELADVDGVMRARDIRDHDVQPRPVRK